MMKAFLVVVLFAVSALAAPTTTTISDVHEYSMQSYNRFRAGSLAAPSYAVDEVFNTMSSSGGLPPVSPACIGALISVFKAANATDCKATFSTVAQLLWSNTTMATNAAVSSYCSSSCVTGLNSTIESYAATCTPVELVEIDLYFVAIGKPFHIFDLLTIVRLPCDTVDPVSGQYCVVSWSNLLVSLANGDKTPTAAECNTCLALFIADLVRWTPLTIRDFYFVDQFCTMDGPVFCWAELQAIQAMPSGNAQTTRICSTSCYQRILIKAILYEATNGTVDTSDLKSLIFLDEICATAPGGQYCFDEFSTVGTTLSQASAAGCALTKCPSTCLALANSLVSAEGCCLNNFLDIAYVAGNASLVVDLTLVIGFVQNTCKVTVPAACPRSDKAIAGQIILHNIAWAAYQANVDAVRAAVFADIAAIIGVLATDIAFQSDSQPSSTGFALFDTSSAGDGVSLSFTVSTSTTESANSGASAYNGQVQAGTIVTPNTQSLNGAFRTNPAAPVVIDSASAVMVTGAAAHVTFSVATLLAAVAVAFFGAL
jgi:hypothetical protein